MQILHVKKSNSVLGMNIFLKIFDQNTKIVKEFQQEEMWVRWGWQGEKGARTKREGQKAGFKSPVSDKKKYIKRQEHSST